MLGLSLGTSIGASGAVDIKTHLISGGALASYMTHSRASSKWVIGSNGLFTEVATDTPAIEYNSDGTLRGVSLEGSCTNVLLHSNDFSNVVWTVFGGTVGADTVDGVFPSYKRGIFNDNSASALGNGRESVAIADDSTSWTASAVISAGTSSVQALAIQYSGGTGLLSGAVFDTTDGTINAVTNFAGTGASAPDDYGIEEVASGVWRVWVTKANNGTGNTTATIRIYAAPSASAATTDLGNSTTGTCYVHHVQFENKSFMTTPIVTTSSAGVRAADYVTFATSDIGFNVSEGMFEMVGELATVNIGARQRFLSIHDGTVNNRLLSREENTNLYWGSTGTPNADILFKTGITARTELDMKWAYKLNDYEAQLIGNASVTDTTAVVPTGLANGAVFYNGYNTSDNAFGWVKSLTYTPLKEAF